MNFFIFTAFTAKKRVSKKKNVKGISKLPDLALNKNQ